MSIRKILKGESMAGSIVTGLKLTEKLLLVAIAVALAGIGYLGYNEYQREQEIKFERESPREEWFDYRSVSGPDRQPIGNELQMTSISRYDPFITVRFNDVLRCHAANMDDQPFVFFSSYESSTAFGERDENEYRESNWVYNAQTPETPRDCIMDSTITITTPNGFNKVQNINSNTIRFR